MSAWELPNSIEIAGKEYPIRTDFRVILDIFNMCQDPDLPEWAKAEGIIEMLYLDPEEILALDEDSRQEALNKANAFIDAGQKGKDKKSPKLMDWEQDAPILIPAVNAVANREIRAEAYIHWWTFLGWFLEIKEGVFSYILSIRQKRAKGKKLEKSERDFLNENSDVVVLKERLNEAEAKRQAEEQAALKELWGE